MDWKEAALKARSWSKSVLKGGLRFMAMSRNEEEGATRLLQENIQTNETRKIVTVQERIEPPKRHRIDYS